MLEIGNGTKIKHKNKYEWVADLIYFDGPVLGLFYNGRHGAYLFSWLDCNDECNRWAILDISREGLGSFLRKEITLLDVFTKSKKIVVFDEYENKRVFKAELTFNEFPSDYIPNENSFLHDRISTPEAKQLAQATSKYVIKLDGELYIENLSEIPKIYQQLYHFLYVVGNADIDYVSKFLSDKLSNMKIGFHVGNLFRTISDIIPPNHKPRVIKIHYNSPGEIELDLLPNISKQITDSFYSISEKEKEIEQIVSDVKSLCKKYNVLWSESEHQNHDNCYPDFFDEKLLPFLNNLLELFVFSEFENNFLSLDANNLKKIRILLAYHRRIKVLIDYQNNGFIEIT